MLDGLRAPDRTWVPRLEFLPQRGWSAVLKVGRPWHGLTGHVGLPERPPAAIFDTLAEDHLHLPRRDRREHLRAAVVRYAARLEHHALRHPLQWFNFFDFWAPPPAPTPNDG